MKTILTLLMAVSTFATLHAQSNENARRIILGNPKGAETYGNHDRDIARGKRNDEYPIYTKENYRNNRQGQIEQANREYNEKIYSIRNNRYLSRDEKDRMIRQLERDRQNRINEINRRYGNDYGRYDDNDCNDRKDNGKHKGWYKKAKNRDKWSNR